MMNIRVLLAIVVPVLIAVSFTQEADAQTLQDSVAAMARAFKGDVGIYAVNLQNGDTVSYNAEKMFPTASVIKIYVLARLYQEIKEGRLAMNDKVVLRDSDKVPGSGILLFMHDGLKLTLGDLSWLMINMSDNVAANLLTDEVDGVMKVTDYIRSLGFKHTMELAKIFDRNVYPDSTLRKKYGIGVTTPRETATFMKELYEGDIVDKKSSEAMIKLMEYQFYNTSIPRFLPTYRDTIEIAHKTGALNATRNDCAIIYTPRTNYVLCVFTTHNKDQRWITDNGAEVFIAKISLLVYNSFVKKEF
jgi:beta-lactamase class A